MQEGVAGRDPGELGVQRERPAGRGRTEARPSPQRVGHGHPGVSSARSPRHTRWRRGACSAAAPRPGTRGASAGSCRCWLWAAAPGRSPRCGCRTRGTAPARQRAHGGHQARPAGSLSDSGSCGACPHGDTHSFTALKPAPNFYPILCLGFRHQKGQNSVSTWGTESFWWKGL